MQTQFQKEQYVRYGANGVCRIEDIRPVPEMKTKDDFYILQPIADHKSVYFIPTDSEKLTSKMRVLLSREEIDALIDTVKGEPLEWIEDRKARLEQFRLTLRECDMLQIMRMVGMLYLRKRALMDQGKKLAPSDEAVLREAETVVENEFAFVLGVPTQDVSRYVLTRLDLI